MVTQSNIPQSILRYLPFIPRIQRLYLNEETAKQMTWHKKGTRFEDETGQLKMGHPSDGEAWKKFDEKYQERAAEARNVSSKKIQFTRCNKALIHVKKANWL